MAAPALAASASHDKAAAPMRMASWYLGCTTWDRGASLSYIMLTGIEGNCEGMSASSPGCNSPA